MAQCLGVMDALTDSPGSILNTMWCLTTIVIPVPISFSVLCGLKEHICYTNIHADKNLYT